MLSRVRAALKVLGLVLLGVTTFYMLWLIDALGMTDRPVKLWGKRWFVIMIRFICNIRIEKEGEICPGPSLLVSNHVSYIDVDVIWASTKYDVVFTPKVNVRDWPFIGKLVRRVDVIFVDRTPAKTQETQSVMQRILEKGKIICIFAESTTGDGRTMLPFKTSLFSLAEQWKGPEPLTVQPVTVVYQSIDGVPMNDENWPHVAWYGDSDFFTHCWRFLRNAEVVVKVIYHPPTALQPGETRKQLSARCEEIVRSANTPVIAHMLAAKIAKEA